MNRAANFSNGVFLLGLVLVMGCGREGERAVAVVGGEEITAAEFKQRYQAYLANFPTRDNIKLRQQILTNMINEKLIYDDLSRKSLDRDDVCLKRFEEIKQQAMLDGYARTVTIDTMTVSEQELWDEFRAFNTKATARYLYAKTENEAWTLKQKLELGSTFASLAREVFEDPGLANNGGYLGSFGWGEMEPGLEEAAFSLPIGEISDPIRINIGYAIVKVENRVRQPLASEFDYAKNKEKLRQAVVARKVVRLVKDAADRVAKDLSPTFNHAALESVFRNWNYVTAHDPAGPVNELGMQKDGNISTMHMASIGGQEWTVEDFIQKMQRTTERQRGRVKSIDDVKDAAIGLAVREVLLEKAREQELDRDPQVLSQIQKVRDQYLLTRWAGLVRDTVGQHGWNEDNLREQFEKNKEQYVIPREVNVAEILVRTKTEAYAMMDRLKRRADFATLARQNSIRLWAAKNGGELGFGTKASYGILSEKIFAAKVGDIIGPERVEPYFGVFKILERREGRPKSFEEAKEEITEQKVNSRKHEVFTEAIKSLRSQAHFSIDMEALANVVLAS